VISLEKRQTCVSKKEAIVQKLCMIDSISSRINLKSPSKLVSENVESEDGSG
jgi:hypothetical protein